MAADSVRHESEFIGPNLPGGSLRLARRQIFQHIGPRYDRPSGHFMYFYESIFFKKSIFIKIAFCGSFCLNLKKVWMQNLISGQKINL